MARDDLLIVVDQDWGVEAEGIQARRYCAHLLSIMFARVTRVGLKFADPDKRYLKYIASCVTDHMPCLCILSHLKLRLQCRFEFQEMAYSPDEKYGRENAA